MLVETFLRKQLGLKAQPHPVSGKVDYRSIHRLSACWVFWLHVNLLDAWSEVRALFSGTGGGSPYAAGKVLRMRTVNQRGHQRRASEKFRVRAGPRVPVAIDRAARRGAESVKTAIFPRIPGTLPTAAAIQAVNQWAEKVRDEFLARQTGLP